MDVTSLRLSWILPQAGAEQYAYQVQAASTAALLVRNAPDLWDSGMVQSSESNGIVYLGVPMRSRTRVFWQVRVWTDEATVTPWSDPATFEMGLLNASDWTAQWI